MIESLNFCVNFCFHYLMVVACNNYSAAICLYEDIPVLISRMINADLIDTKFFFL